MSANNRLVIWKYSGGRYKGYDIDVEIEPITEEVLSTHCPVFTTPSESNAIRLAEAYITNNMVEYGYSFVNINLLDDAKLDWRPKELKNPYLIKDLDGGLYNKYPEFNVFEEAIVATIDAIKSSTEYFNSEHLQANVRNDMGYLTVPVSGTIVFIPDEE